MARPQLSRVPTGNSAAVRFSRPARLRKHADFENVYRDGRRIFSTHSTVFFLPRDPGPLPQQTKGGPAGGSGPARVGFTVRRGLGTAVERNRIRRRLREAVRLNLGAVGNAVDVVIHPKKSALTANFAELREEIAAAFGKIKLQVAGASSGPSLRSRQVQNEPKPGGGGETVGSA